MTYYHFVRVNKDGQAYLGYNDNRIVEVGETVTVGGTPVLCQHGLHASKRIIDALEYCPVGNVALCRVTLGGTVIHDDDKSVASERTITAMLPVEKTNAILREFARWCALSVVHLWDAPDVVRQYLETGDETLRVDAAKAAKAAKAAAWAAARAEAKAAEAAAEAAARAADTADTAWAAEAAKASAEAEAWAAWAAAWAVAWAARAVAATARAAARVESRHAQEAELQRLFHEAAEGGGREP